MDAILFVNEPAEKRCSGRCPNTFCLGNVFAFRAFRDI